MSAPLAVTTTDKTTWTRRAVTRDGLALYAPADVCRCPAYVMATLAELAEHGITGSADVLPVPAGPEVQDEDSRREFLADLASAACQYYSPESRDEDTWREVMKVLEAAELTVSRDLFLALYDGAPPALFTTAEEARKYCDDVAPVDARGRCWDWVVEDGVHIQFWTHPDDDRPTDVTSGEVLPIAVQGLVVEQLADRAAELESLRARVAELESRALPDFGEHLARLATPEGRAAAEERVMAALAAPAGPVVMSLGSALNATADRAEGAEVTS